jgi:hypothetical protein
MARHHQNANVRVGLPKLRADWVAARDAAADACQTQMFYARCARVCVCVGGGGRLQHAAMGAHRIRHASVLSPPFNSHTTHTTHTHTTHTHTPHTHTHCRPHTTCRRAGVVTEEMAFVAAREGMDAEFVRSEVRVRSEE